jgi:hypothetical protein
VEFTGFVSRRLSPVEREALADAVDQVNDFLLSELVERPAEEHPLERAALARARSERQIVEAITAAQLKGVSWTRISELLGTSAQAAQPRYGNVITVG